MSPLKYSIQTQSISICLKLWKELEDSMCVGGAYKFILLDT